MKRGRLGLFFRAPDYPLLGLAQVLATKQEAAVRSVSLPLFGTSQQTSMRMFPIQVGIQRFDQVREV